MEKLPCLLWLLALCCVGCDNGLPEPSIDHLVPSQGTPGQIVDVIGRGFGTAAGFVSFAGIAAEDNGWEQDRIRVWVPSGLPAGSEVLVVVTADGTPSSPVPFLVKGP